ncbi:MAG TPA: BTAD domain-containing putative transcriptional regulator, partial [Micromonosporaceae bacterium]|nr:BTAD domain-containing putative transcriptional regulator [Micromonosporaceae bacterium]
MATNDDSLMFSVLGCFEMRAGGRLVEIRGATAQRLLGVLLLYANTWVHESRLVDLTWGGANATRNALHCAVARLRRALAHHDAGSVRLQRSDAGYRMEVTADQLDAPQFLELRRQATAEPDPGERFELLLRGLGLWRGQVLADTGEWLRTDPNVLALERARLDCVYEAADLGLARGEAARVLPLVEQ